MAGLLLAISISQGMAEERIPWIPIDDPSAPDMYHMEAHLSPVLSPFQGRVRLLECRYEKALLKQLHLFSGEQQGKEWEYAIIASKIPPGKGIRQEPMPEGTTAAEITFNVRRLGPSQDSTGFALAFDFLNWDSENYLMIPSSVYNGNRNRLVNRPYAQGLDRNDLYKKDLPQTTAPVPQLSPNQGDVSRLEVLTGNAATPAMCIFDRKNNRGFILLVEQGIRKNGEILDNGLIFEESPDRTQASLVVSFPGIREKKPEFIGFSTSPDRGTTWNTGDTCSVRVQIYSFPARDIPALLDQFMSIRKNLTGPNSPRNLIPQSEVLRMMTDLIDGRFYRGRKHQFYCPENAEWISYGWIGGLMNTFPMLALGDQRHRNQVKSTFDFGLGYGQGKSGYFYGALNKDGKPFGREGYDETPEIVLTRKNADVLYWMVKQFMLLKQQGHAEEINPEWEQKVHYLADAFVKTWKRERQWGNFLHNGTGDIAVYNTSGGVMAVAGLTLAAAYFNEPSYLTTAQEAAEYYNGLFQNTGMTTGACADILQNADSETAIALATSFMTLHEASGDSVWLDRCRNAAHLVATWTVSYDYILPPQTPLAQHGAKLAGAVWASTQNKHSAPGFCTQSGEVLFRLYRQSGDERYAELLCDVLHAHAEGIQPNGRISERLTYCDADSRGSWEGYTGWNETNGAMMALEIPGIYVRTDSEHFYCFDHVQATVKSRSGSSAILEIFNPTVFDANVSIFAESKVEAGKPLPVIAFPQWQHVTIKAGQTITIDCPAQTLQKTNY